MSNVDLSIGGRTFKVACAQGEEQHVAGLGRLIDSKIATMDGIAGQSEARMLLFASLLLADELHELKNRAGISTGGTDPDPAIAEKLESVALALEKCASGLESGA